MNPRADVVQGLPETASLLAIDDRVDLAVIAVPAPAVLPALKECVAKGVRGAVVILGSAPIMCSLHRRPRVVPAHK